MPRSLHLAAVLVAVLTALPAFAQRSAPLNTFGLESAQSGAPLSPYDQFGTAVARSGDRAIIGATGTGS